MCKSSERIMRELIEEHEMMKFLEVSIEENLRLNKQVEFFQMNDDTIYGIIADKIKEMNILKHTNESLNRRLLKKDQITESLKADVICYKHDIARLQSEIEQLSNNRYECQIENNRLDRELDHVLGVNNDLNKENSLLRSDIRNLSSQILFMGNTIKAYEDGIMKEEMYEALIQHIKDLEAELMNRKEIECGECGGDFNICNCGRE